MNVNLIYQTYLPLFIQTLCALLVLEKLVRYSPHLRLVMVCEREFEQLIQEGRESVARNKLHPVLTAGLGVVSQKGVTEITHSANSSEQVRSRRSYT